MCWGRLELSFHSFVDLLLMHEVDRMYYNIVVEGKERDMIHISAYIEYGIEATHCIIQFIT